MRLLLISAVMIPTAIMLLSGCVKGQAEPPIRDIEPRPVASSDDQVNKRVAALTVDGLVLAVTIDGNTVRLDSATPARISTASGARSVSGGDRVTAVGFAGGVRISETSVPDGVLNAQEGVGIVRLSRRQIVLSLPAPRALDTVEITAPATNATARLDVRSAYAAYCRGDKPDPKLCPR